MLKELSCWCWGNESIHHDPVGAWLHWIKLLPKHKVNSAVLYMGFSRGEDNPCLYTQTLQLINAEQRVCYRKDGWIAGPVADDYPFHRSWFPQGHGCRNAVSHRPLRWAIHAKNFRRGACMSCGTPWWPETEQNRDVLVRITDHPCGSFCSSCCVAAALARFFQATVSAEAVIHYIINLTFS